MANHAVLIQNKVAALDVASWNRSAVCSGSLDNGNVFQLAGSCADTGYAEVWWATTPIGSAITLSSLWMAAAPDTVVNTVDGNLTYRGLNQDPRRFYIAGSVVFDAYEPHTNDIITLSADAFGNPGSVNTYANASDSSYQLWWGAARSASALSYKVVATTYISVGGSAIDNQRVTAYKLVCLGNGAY